MVELLASPWFPLIAGLLSGTAMGYAARRSHFCTLNAIERWAYLGDSSGLKAWALAALTAMLVTQGLLFAGVITLEKSFYLAPAIGLAGSVVGGLAFGFGMALVGTCSFGALVRTGGGSLKALVALIVLGFFALSAQRGLLSHVREVTVDRLTIDVSAAGNQSLTALVAGITGSSASSFVVPLIAVVMAVWIFRGGAARHAPGKMLAGLVIGLAIPFGWLVTITAAGHAFDPVQVEAGSFVVPVGDTLMLIAARTGTMPDYGVGLVAGVVAGSAISAMQRRDLRWEACDDAREMSRHMVGAMLMGVGGVFAMGCTIGQGVTAFSVLAASAPVTVLFIIIGARLGLSYMLEGRLFPSFDSSARQN